MSENKAQNEECKILKLALDNRQIAVAVLGQALMDEGGIGSQAIYHLLYKQRRSHASLENCKFFRVR